MKDTRAKNGGKDAYYTKPELARYYIQITKNILKRRKITDVIEPSAGNGSFFIPLTNFFDNVLAYDLEPKLSSITRKDFFEVDIQKDSLVIGNPPFGFAGNLAVKFFNHAAKNAKAIAFILPRSFQKDSIKSRLDNNFHLIFEEICPENSFLVDGEEYDVPCVFQIWVNYGSKKVKRKNAPRILTNPYFDFVKKGEGDFCIRRVGGRSGQILEGLNYTESSTYFCKSKRDDAKLALNACYSKLEKLRDLTAGVRSISKNEINIILMEYYEKKS